jgi:catechol 2,3-dioxygenase-like lactoylglutathione lyase family enzyme
MQKGDRLTASESSYPCAAAHVGLSVPDLEEAIRWYCEALGCGLLFGPDRLEADGSYAGRAAADVFGPAFREVRMAHLSMANGVAIELFEFLVPETARRTAEAEYWPAGFSHVCVIDPDIERRVAAIRSNGGKVRTKIWEVFEGEPYRFCHCEDPFGNIIEVYSHSHEQVFANRRHASAAAGTLARMG